MKNNKEKGFTLLELVVVIAISSILLAAIGISLNTVFVNRAKSASRNIYNMIGTAQNLGMSKDNIYFVLSGKDNGEITADIVSGTAPSNLKTIESKSLGSKVEVAMTVGGTEKKITPGLTLMIKIDRKTGGFAGTFSYSNMHVALGQCTKISVGGGNNLYEIKLIPLTGKISYI